MENTKSPNPPCHVPTFVPWAPSDVYMQLSGVYRNRSRRRAATVLLVVPRLNVVRSGYERPGWRPPPGSLPLFGSSRQRSHVTLPPFPCDHQLVGAVAGVGYGWLRRSVWCLTTTRGMGFESWTKRSYSSSLFRFARSSDLAGAHKIANVFLEKLIVVVEFVVLLADGLDAAE